MADISKTAKPGLSLTLYRSARRHDIDEVVPDRPVFLYRACWHIGVANTKALEIAGILEEGTGRLLVDQVSGGKIDTEEVASGEDTHTTATGKQNDAHCSSVQTSDATIMGCLRQASYARTLSTW